MPKKTKPDALATMVDELEAFADTLTAGGMEAVRAKYTVRTADPSPPPAVAPAAIAAARAGLGVSQPVFGKFLGVSAATVKGWEQGGKVPTPPVALLLADMAERPGHWRKKLAVAIPAAV